MVKDILEKSIQNALRSMAFDKTDVHLEHPADFAHGDYSTNVAMVLAKELKESPKELAERIVVEILKQKPEEVEKIEVAGAGFINFYLSRTYFAGSVDEILRSGDRWGRNDTLKDKKVMIEYTDPNPFKEFHIGHLMSNAVGESLSRIIEFSGAEVKRANYQGDVGLHVAKAIWSKMLPEHANWTWGASYTHGSREYENHKEEINALNKKIYKKSDPEVNKLYEEGKKKSLEDFDKMYKTLGTVFDYNFFESETGPFGKKLVEEEFEKGVFEKSEGAVIFRGEEYGLHTRVFINSEDLPTYEAKELGLTKIKHDAYPYDLSFVVTGNEIQEYFKVILKVMGIVYPDLAEKTKHVPHGMLRLPGGKMSSRKGNVMSGKELLAILGEKVGKKMEERNLSDKEKTKEYIAVGAIKYAILKQSRGKDIIFDMEKSLSFEGDSGPYLQYAHTRARSVLEKAHSEKIDSNIQNVPKEITTLERLLYQFPEIVQRALDEYEPHYLVTYLIELAGAFNTFYAEVRIVDAGEHAPYYVALTRTFQTTMHNGLDLLGISVPNKM